MKNYTVIYWDRVLKQTGIAYVRATSESGAIVQSSSKSLMVLKIDKT